MYIVFDTETTGLPRRYDAPVTDVSNWPRCVQIAWQIHDEMGRLVEHQDYLIKPEGFNIPYDAERVHGISTELAMAEGVPLAEVLEKFNIALSKSRFIVGQNVGFDLNVMGCEFHRFGVDSPLLNMPVLDTCTEVTASLLQIPGGRGGKFKLPTLTELHEYLFEEPFAEAHNATADVEATTRCFLELLRREVYSPKELGTDGAYLTEFKIANPDRIKRIGLKHVNLKSASEALRPTKVEYQTPTGPSDTKAATGENFAHLHNHTQFSVLQSTISVKELVKAAVANKMPAVAMTDHANLMGAFLFVREAMNHNKGAKARIEAAIGL
jgi:DNA polymerase-3 subunit alpha